jgi:toxin ParE1/3/4
MDEQAEYLAVHGSVEVGLRFYRAAEEAFQLLSSRPKLGRVIKFGGRSLTGMRMFPLKGFPEQLVFYRPVEDGIEIIRVLHGARDLESLFQN